MHCGGISAWTWGACVRERARWVDFVTKGEPVNRSSVDALDRRGLWDFFSVCQFKVLAKLAGRNAWLSFLTRRMKWKHCITYKDKPRKNKGKDKKKKEGREGMWVTGKYFLLHCVQGKLHHLFCTVIETAVQKEKKWCDFTRSPNRMALSTSQMNN